MFTYYSVICCCSEKAAFQALKASDWHLEGAFDVFYSQPQIRTSTDTRHLEELYKRYKGKASPYISYDLLKDFLSLFSVSLLLVLLPFS